MKQIVGLRDGFGVRSTPNSFAKSRGRFVTWHSNAESLPRDAAFHERLQQTDCACWGDFDLEPNPNAFQTETVAPRREIYNIMIYDFTFLGAKHLSNVWSQIRVPCPGGMRLVHELIHTTNAARKSDWWLWKTMSQSHLTSVKGGSVPTRKADALQN